MALDETSGDIQQSLNYESLTKFKISKIGALNVEFHTAINVND